ncbi:MAG TPA: hypothetical protein VGC93_19930 [Thermoanaerobaculia bacterium]
MESQDRRRFLQVLGAGAVGVLVDGPAAALPSKALPAADGAVAELRANLLSQRDRIRSLRLRFTAELRGATETVKKNSWLIAGDSLFLYSAGRHRLEHYRAGFDVIEISNGGLYRQAFVEAGGKSRVLYTGPLTANRRPAATLERFLPVLRNVPAYDLGVDLVDGERVQVVGQGDVRYFVAARRPAVIRVDIFSTATALRERIRFSDFESTTAGVDFPTRLTSSRFGATDKVVKEVDLAVSELEINPALEDSLFAIEGGTRHG